MLYDQVSTAQPPNQSTLHTIPLAKQNFWPRPVEAESKLKLKLKWGFKNCVNKLRTYFNWLSIGDDERVYLINAIKR